MVPGQRRAGILQILFALRDGVTRRPAEVVEQSDGAGVCGLTDTWRQAGVAGGTGPSSKAQEGFIIVLWFYWQTQVFGFTDFFHT